MQRYPSENCEAPLLPPDGCSEECPSFVLQQDRGHVDSKSTGERDVFCDSIAEDTPFLREWNPSLPPELSVVQYLPKSLRNAEGAAPPACVASIVCVIEGTFMQLLLLLLFIFHCAITFYGYFANVGETIIISFVVVFIFNAEHALMILNEGKNHFGPPPFRSVILITELFLLLALALELFALIVWCVTAKTFANLIGLPVAAMTFYPRCRRLQLAFRRRVSSERRRYRENGFDLDLSIVHSTVLAMSWPAENFERFFRNPAEEVEALLDMMYGPHAYLVVNLCSERGYKNPGLFHGNFLRYIMDDHNPAELDEILSFVRKAGGFVRKDPEHRAVVVHCKGGKGRTGTMICAYLMHSGLQPTADRALEHFRAMRTAPGESFQGVQTPSQERYVRYFEKLLASMRPPFALKKNVHQRRITHMELRNIPFLWWEGGIGKLWFVVILKPSTERHVIYISNPTVSFNPHPPDDSVMRVRSSLHDICVPAEDSLYRDSQEVNLSTPISPCHDTFFVSVCNQRIESATFDREYSASVLREKKELKVTLEARQLQSISPVVDDVVVKFYYAQSSPNPLAPPMQFWFHTAMEGNEIHLSKLQLDGPHRDAKGKCYPNDFSVMLRFKNVVDKD
ncbi:putative tyrosine phosphatase isoform [Trypanosoma cruzi]|nr:putative tyrosine phosphatase isoform [Trypanosoma cruzi]